MDSGVVGRDKGRRQGGGSRFGAADRGLAKL
jgi:hypothetical protein